MKKVKLSVIFTVFLLLLSVTFTAFANGNYIYTTSSDGSLSSNYIGNSDNVFSLKNPQELVTVSTTKSYVISGIAQTDSVIAVYAYNSQTDRYDRMYTDDGILMETKVGASGLFAQSVNLNSGKNQFMIVAAKGTSTQVIKLEITLNQNLLSKILNFGANLSQLFIR